MTTAQRGLAGGSAFQVMMDNTPSGDIQPVKLAYGAASDATLVPADAKGLSVLVTNLVAGTVTASNVNDAAVDTQLLAANANRKFFSIYNDSSSFLYVRFSSSAASATAFNVPMPAGAYYESGPFVYTGEIRGIWSVDSTGAARLAEA